jgi:dTDP-4-dehydrorhamnose reductase
MDITRPPQVAEALDRHRPGVVVHAAAFTDVAAAERERDACWQVNVHGTRVIASAVRERGLFLVHISTDYVFDGERGGYREQEPPGRPRNFYALSKIVAEELARFAPRHLVVRTSFRPREWLHPVAFTDLWTSQDYVDVIAPKIALAVLHRTRLGKGTVHIGTERKTAYDLARRRKPDVRPGVRAEAGVDLPRDVSLDIARWERFEASLAG